MREQRFGAFARLEFPGRIGREVRADPIRQGLMIGVQDFGRV